MHLQSVLVRTAAVAAHILLGGLCGGPGRASVPGVQQLDAHIIPQDSPIALRECNVKNQHTATFIDGTRTSTITSNIWISFENQSSKMAVALKVGFVFKDYFGAVEYTAYGESAGTFSPGATISPKFNPVVGTVQADNPFAYSVTFPASIVGDVDCFVSAVRFDDGTFWNAAPPSQPMPTPT
jgi:hypothetical protein